MFSSLLVFFAVAQSGSESLLNQIVPNPTGNNGYEDYLMACDIVRTPEMFALIHSTPEAFRQSLNSNDRAAPTQKLSESQLAIARTYADSNLLEIRRAAVTRGARVLDLLTKGNKKPVYDPRVKIAWSERFPEVRQFRVLGSLSLAASYVAFADGQSARGTAYLADAIVLGQNIRGGFMPAHLNGIVIQEKSFELFEKLLPRLSQNSAQVLQNLSAKLLAEKTPALRVIERGIAINRDYYSGMMDQVSASEPSEGPESARSALSMLQGMSSTERQHVVDLCIQRATRIQNQMAAQFQRPESEWGAYTEPDPVDIKDETKVSSMAMLVAYLCDNQTQSFATLGKHEVRNRTQLRLMGLASAIVKFKWDYDRLPLKLSEAVGEKASFDPVAKDQFQYEIIQNGFRIYSKGSKESGEIGLRYDYSSKDSTPPPP